MYQNNSKTKRASEQIILSNKIRIHKNQSCKQFFDIKVMIDEQQN